MRVLVLGGAGYIGGAVTEELNKRDIPFVVYDSLMYHSDYLQDNLFWRGDIRNDDLKAEINSYTHIIWLAALVGDELCDIDYKEARKVNLDAVKELSKIYKGKIVFASTCSVYGASKDTSNEDSPTKPLSYYSELKLEAEKYLKNHVILRLGTVYGYSTNRFRTDLVVNKLVIDGLNNKLTVFSGEQKRPFIHVRDAGSAFVDALTYEKGIYNKATENLTIKELAEKISKRTGCKITYRKNISDKRDYSVNTFKGIDIEVGITEMIEAILTGRLKNPDNKVHHNFKSYEKHLSGS